MNVAWRSRARLYRLFRGGLRSKERFQFWWISCCAGQPKCHSSGGCGRAARNIRVSFLFFFLFARFFVCYFFFFFCFKVSRINRRNNANFYFDRLRIENEWKIRLEILFFFFSKDGLFEREKNTFARV